MTIQWLPSSPAEAELLQVIESLKEAGIRGKVAIYLERRAADASEGANAPVWYYWKVQGHPQYSSDRFRFCSYVMAASHDVDLDMAFKNSAALAC